MKTLKTPKIGGILLLSLMLTTISCVSEQSEPIIDCTLDPIVITLTESTDTGCGDPIGSFTLSATGGEEPYAFTTNDQTNADGFFESLEAGTYDVTVTDAKGCIAEIDVTIQNQEGVNLDELEATIAGCGTTAGAIEITASGGLEPYTYTLNGENPQTENTFTGLGIGSYTVAVADQLGCETSSTVDVLSGISYESSVEAIIETNCSISGCHNGSVSPNLSSFSSIQSSASRIMARTQDKSMPRGRTLTQTQIDALACWVNDGALQN